PQAGLAMDLEGPDSHHIVLPPAPRLDSAEEAGEAAELYWMALARDVRFDDYGSDPLIARAAQDLSRMLDFRGSKAGGQVTPGTIFRGTTPGDLAGPWLSQYLTLDFAFGANPFSQKMRTVMPGVSYMTNYSDWLAVQNGLDPSGNIQYDSTPRYIRNLRDMAQWVHVDALYQAYLHACLIILGQGTRIDPGLPLYDSKVQAGFAQCGGPHILTLVTEVATRALKAVWYQKWFVHHRLRPEEFGGRVHNRRSGAASYALHADILNSAALDEVFNRYGTYLLPQAFAEGSPTHSSYGSGHATVAGACVTALKAFFDETDTVKNPMVVNADGTGLVPYEGPALTVGGELNKVATNVGFGRNGAGIHWRSDAINSLKLGEEVTICILQEQKASYNDNVSMTLTKFDGTKITI
ncbi:MAG TPA: vanadium-dependent haloperoxidase, partial [Blastocatellia bacterium]